MTGKELSLTEDLLCAKHCALFFPRRENFYTLPKAPISIFFLALGARLVWVQVPTPSLPGCVALGSSPNLSEPPVLTRSGSGSFSAVRRIPGSLVE